MIRLKRPEIEQNGLPKPARLQTQTWTLEARYQVSFELLRAAKAGFRPDFRPKHQASIEVASAAIDTHLRGFQHTQKRLPQKKCAAVDVVGRVLLARSTASLIDDQQARPIGFLVWLKTNGFKAAVWLHPIMDPCFPWSDSDRSSFFTASSPQHHQITGHSRVAVDRSSPHQPQPPTPPPRVWPWTRGWDRTKTCPWTGKVSPP